MEITQGLRDSPVRLPESTILGYRSKDASIRLALNRALLMARVQPINEGESPTGGKIADRLVPSLLTYLLLMQQIFLAACCGFS